ncbi:YwiC-like family protein [Virgibacillus sp. AGTR]|uniref:YwiC-like family protein n=1 Tax=Virgibacillus sp. AGTR TaxID=2812055 RepID=UPI001D16C862|nr:YwiC-like family protein [Virgibacillus sp. AGTR]MCC2252233.1 YwiC-like family protein [Virgibacillus sp. AGTR]
MKRKWTLVYGGVALLIGTLTAQLGNYVSDDNFNFSIAPLIGVIPIALILIVINIVQVYRKNDETPDLDERTVKNILKFQLFSSNIFLGLLFISLSVITFLDITKVSTFYLWLIILIYMCISGIGTLIVKRQ